MRAATLPVALPWTPAPDPDLGPAVPPGSPSIVPAESSPDAPTSLAERKRALEDLLRARKLQAQEPPLRCEDYRQRPLVTGAAALDTLLQGGFPRGELSEIHGPASSGRTGVLLSLLARTTAAGAPVAKLVEFREMMAGVDVEQRHWEIRRPKGFFGEAQEADRILAAGKHEGRTLELGRHFAHDMNGLRFEVLKMIQMVGAHRVR